MGNLEGLKDNISKLSNKQIKEFVKYIMKHSGKKASAIKSIEKWEVQDLDYTLIGFNGYSLPNRFSTYQLYNGMNNEMK